MIWKWEPCYNTKRLDVQGAIDKTVITDQWKILEIRDILRKIQKAY